MPRMLEQRKSYHPDLQYMRRTRDALAEDDRYPQDVRTALLAAFDMIIASFHVLGVDGSSEAAEKVAWQLIEMKARLVIETVNKRVIPATGT